MSATPASLEIVVELSGLQLAPGGLEVVQGRARERVETICDDLGLPVAPNVTVRCGGGPPRGDGSPSISIEGRACRLEVADATGGEGDPDTLANRIAAAVEANRLALVTPSLIGSLADSFPVEAITLLPEAVRRRCSVEVAARIARDRFPDLGEDARRHHVELMFADASPRTVDLELGPALYDRMLADVEFAEKIGLMRDGTFFDLGVVVPPIRLMPCKLLGDREFRARIGELRTAARRTLRDDENLVNERASTLEARCGVVGRPARNPVSGAPCAIVAAAAAEKCEAAGLTTWDASGYLVLSLAQLVRANIETIVTVTAVQATLARLSAAFPLPIVDILERFSPVYVTAVLRALVREGFSIRDLRSIMEAMLELKGERPRVAAETSTVIAPAVAHLSAFPRDPDGHLSPEDCADCVRIAMRRYWTHAQSRGSTMSVVATSAATEDRLRQQADERASEIAGHSALVAATCAALDRATTDWPVAILTAVDVRRRLRALLALELPGVPVLSRAEIDPSALVSAGVIDWQ